MPLLSDETLTGDPRLTAIIAGRLHHHFPQARIIFTIRRQPDMIRSFYARHGRVLFNTPAPYSDHCVDFGNWLEHAWRNRPASVLGVADYARTIDIYHALFGAERIAILLLEQWTTDEIAFADRLSTLLDVDAAMTRALLGHRRTHTQETSRHVRYDRLRKRFPAAGRMLAHLPISARAMGGDFLKRGDRQQITFPAGWKEKLAGSYRQGNLQLIEQYQLSLREYAYPV